MTPFAAFLAAVIALGAAFALDVFTIGRKWERRGDMLVALGVFLIALGFLLLVVGK